MKVALVSLDQAWEDKEANKRRVLTFLSRAKALDADLAIFPEMTLTGFSMDTAVTAEPDGDSESLAWFTRQAQEHGMALVAGYVRWNEGNTKGINTSVLIDGQGCILGSYDKIHPFSISGEDRHYEKGDRLCSCRFGGLTIGLTICYDLRFGALYAGLSAQCDMIINIANWASLRTSHWSTLLRARAIEHQLFMIGVNRSGTDSNGTCYDLSSAIFDPFGTTVQPLVDEGEFSLYEIDPAQVARVRTAYPIMQDRRNALYRETCFPVSDVDRDGKDSV